MRFLQRQIGDAVVAESPCIRTPDVAAVSSGDLARMFDLYDQRFLGGLIRRAVAPGRIGFRLSNRMTRSAGSAARLPRESGAADFRISVSAHLLFDGFAQGDPDVTVAGLPCATRLEALQRVVEHEIVHVIEYAATGGSSCRRRPFQDIASALFGHQEFTHQLLTRQVRAARNGIVVGASVVFEHDGRQWSGRVNRITKRATVLVPDPGGALYADGRRYAKRYVPLEALRPA